MNSTRTVSTRRPSPRKASFLTLAAGALLLPTLLAGCATSDSSPTTGTASAGSSSASAQLGQCLRDAGYDVDDPDLSKGVVVAVPAGADPEEYSAAFAECRAALPESQGGGASNQKASPDELAEAQAANLAVAECVREKGFDDFPDPVDGEFPRENWSTSGGDPRQDAFFACSDEFGPNASSAGE